MSIPDWQNNTEYTRIQKSARADFLVDILAQGSHLALNNTVPKQTH